MNKLSGFGKLRSKYHHQNLAVHNEQIQRNNFLVKNSQMLMTIRQDDMRSKSFERAAQAKSLISNIRPFSIDDDPQFIFSQRILRAIAHFGLEHMPLTQSLVELHTKHTFMMDAQAVSSFCAIIQRLTIRDKADVVEKMKGRIKQVADDFNSMECGFVMKVVSSPDVSQQLACSALLHSCDLDGHTMTDLILSTCKVDAHFALEQRVDTIFEWIEGPAFTRESLQSLVHLFQSCGTLVPRRLVASLLSVIQRTFLTDMSVREAIEILNMLRHTSYRHERLSFRLVSRVCQAPSSNDALTALRELSHFYFINDEVYFALASAANATNVAAMCECFSRVRLSPIALFGGPLHDLCGALIQTHPTELVQILSAAVHLPDDFPKNVEKNLVSVVQEAKQRSGSLLEQIDVSVLSSSSKFKAILAAA